MPCMQFEWQPWLRSVFVIDGVKHPRTVERHEHTSEKACPKPKQSSHGSTKPCVIFKSFIGSPQITAEITMLVLTLVTREAGDTARSSTTDEDLQVQRALILADTPFLSPRICYYEYSSPRMHTIHLRFSTHGRYMSSSSGRTTVPPRLGICGGALALEPRIITIIRLCRCTHSITGIPHLYRRLGSPRLASGIPRCSAC